MFAHHEDSFAALEGVRAGLEAPHARDEDAFAPLEGTGARGEAVDLK